jgi:Uma2 family endonuclease
MTTITPPDQETVLICGITWDAYQRIDELFGEFHTRHTYDRGTLEMRRVLYGVPPETYRQFLETLPDHYLPHSYDGWTLEMMTPLRDHEWIKRLIGRMLEAMALAMDIPIQSTGSTTLSPSKHDRGLQPDESYYFGTEVATKGKETYQPGEDPPPDLVVEVETTNPVVPRLPLYAQIGVREIWRYKNEGVEFFRLADRGEYERIDRSVVFPFIAADDIRRFLHERDPGNENAVVRAFVRWARGAWKAGEKPARRKKKAP